MSEILSPFIRSCLRWRACVTVAAFFIVLCGTGAFAYREFDITLGEAYEEMCTDGCNVIVIVSDTLSARHMSMYGYERDTTPRLAALFTENGIVYESVWAPAAWTVPSFAGMLRSKYPSDLRIGDLVHASGSIPALTVERGVETVAFLKEIGTPITITQGIDNAFATADVRYTPYEKHEEGFENAREWLRSYAERPIEERGRFFMFVHDTTPHDPYNPPEEYRPAFGGPPETYYPSVTRKDMESGGARDWPEEKRLQVERQYDQEVLYFDSLAANFIESIPEFVLAETIVIITADHGESFGDHGGIFYHNASLYEPQLHVPLLVLAPGYHGERVEAPVSLIDLAPTVMRTLGLGEMPDAAGSPLPLPGFDEFVRRHFPIAQKGDMSIPIPTDVRTIPEDMYDMPLFPTTTQIAIRNGPWKLIARGDGGREVFDLRTDSEELSNMYYVRSHLKRRYQEYIDVTESALNALMAWRGIELKMPRRIDE